MPAPPLAARAASASHCATASSMHALNQQGSVVQVSAAKPPHGATSAPFTLPALAGTAGSACRGGQGAEGAGRGVAGRG
jgi:hypothetical protein